jgi:hypothetical protein
MTLPFVLILLPRWWWIAIMEDYTSQQSHIVMAS